MNVPSVSLGWRLFSLMVGGLLFIWLTLEDTQLPPIILLSLLATSLWLLNPLLQRFASQAISPVKFILAIALLSALIGAGTVILTTIMMFLKTAWHSHLFPDYPAPMMFAMLQRLPLWTVAGLLLGTSFGLYSWAIYGVSGDRA
ncbi:MAG: hypothetical protein CL607_24865 [Anaerolineaceae bacterium]|nr:hypothetical protein [Anaerolineaceae bacterium]